MRSMYIYDRRLPVDLSLHVSIYAYVYTYIYCSVNINRNDQLIYLSYKLIS